MATSITTLPQATQIKTADGLDVLAGIWLIAAPFVLSYSTKGGSTTSDVLVGIAVILLAGYELIGENYRQAVPNWINVLLGIWLVAAPFVLGFPSGSAAMWNDVIMGVIVAVLALFGALSVPADREIYN